MTSPNPLRRAAHMVPVAALSLLLLTAGMCRQAEEPPQPQTAEPNTLADFTEPAPEPPVEAGPTPAELEASERQAAIAEAERQLAEREAALAAEEERLRQEREMQAERDRLAAERAAAAERERQLAARERQLQEQEAELARLEEARADEAREPVLAEAAAPEPLPEPTGNYEGNYDEPWRDSREVADGEVGEAPTAAEPAAPGPFDEPVAAPTTRASVQAGERLEVQTVSMLSSETARVGDTFSTRLVTDLRDRSGQVVIPAGAEVVGRVTEAAPYRRGGGPATLAVEFTDIVVSPEQTVGIRATFVELGADRRKNRKKVVAGAVVGAILGHILGGDGSKNVVVGAAAGAAAGGAMVASARDRDAEIPAGQIIALELEEVVTVQIQYGAVAPR